MYIDIYIYIWATVIWAKTIHKFASECKPGPEPNGLGSGMSAALQGAWAKHIRFRKRRPILNRIYSVQKCALGQGVISNNLPGSHVRYGFFVLLLVFSMIVIACQGIVCIHTSKTRLAWFVLSALCFEVKQQILLNFNACTVLWSKTTESTKFQCYYEEAFIEKCLRCILHMQTKCSKAVNYHEHWIHTNKNALMIIWWLCQD